MGATVVTPREKKVRAQAGQATRLGLWLMLLVILVAFGLRVWRLGAQSLWVDEGISVLFSSRSPEELLKTVIAEDLHPPLYYLALHYWMTLAGKSEYSLRFLSVVVGLLAVPVMYQLTRCLLLVGRKPGLGAAPVWGGGLAGTLAAVSPFLVYYSQEARNYMMVTTWTLLASLALWKGQEAILERSPLRSRAAWWLVYIVFASFTLYTNYFGALLLLAHVIYLAAVFIHHRQFPVLGAVSLIATAGLYSPWLKPGIAQMLRLQANPDFWAGTLSLQALVERLFIAFSLGPKAQGAVPVIAAFALIAFVSLISLIRFRELPLGRSELFLLLYLVVPLAIVYVITARAPKFTERYLIMAAPGFYLLIARGLSFLQLQGRALLAESRLSGQAVLGVFGVATLAIVGFSGYFTVQILSSPEFARDNNRAAVHYIEANSKPGDVIVLMMNAPQAFQYYYKGDLPWYGLHPGDNFQAGAAQLNQITQGKERLWLFLWNSEWADPAGFVLDSLAAAAPRALPDRRFQGVEVRAYSLASRPRFSAEFQPQTKLNLNFENKVELIGFDSPQSPFSPGKEGAITLYWQALQPLTDDYVVSLRLKRGGFYWGNREVRPTNYFYPTTSWKVGLPIRGLVSLSPLPGTPPGQYQVEVALHSVGTPGAQRDLPVLGPGGAPQGTSVVLGQVMVERAAKPPSAADLGVGELVQTQLSASVSLLRGETAARAVRPGDLLPLTIFWQASEKPRDSLRILLSMLDSQGNSHILYQNHPVGGAYPTDNWQAGEVVRDQYGLTVPPEAAPGPASLQVALVAATGASGPTASIARLEIQERVRLMEQPQGIQRPADANLGNIARLVGYDLSQDSARPGETLKLVLYWQALVDPKAGYTVFTHLLDGQNKIYAQQDNPPQRGLYPTTSWSRGEYVRDEYELAINPAALAGDYVIEVGMYDVATGKRLSLLGADEKPLDNRVLLGKVRVGP